MTFRRRVERAEAQRRGLSSIRASIVRDGLDVAHSSRERGFELVVYRVGKDRTFAARPVRVRTAESTFVVDLSNPIFDLIYAFAIGGGDEHTVYAMKEAEVRHIRVAMGFPERSKARHSKYEWNEGLRELLKPYVVAPFSWTRFFEGDNEGSDRRGKATRSKGSNLSLF